MIDRVDQVVAVALANHHRRLILYQNPEQKHYHGKDMDESGQRFRDDYVSWKKIVVF